MTDRRRLGVVVPSVNTVIERWYPQALPAPVSLHVSRMLIESAVTPETVAAMDADGIEAARTLATCRPDLIVYGCTASSLIGGRRYDLELMDELTRATGVTTLTTTECVLRALSHLGVASIVATSPYTEQLGHFEVEFLEAAGLEVTAAAHLGIAGSYELASPGADVIVKLVRTAWRQAPTSNAVFIGCMNLNSHIVIESLEQELGVPVVTATQAVLWTALGELGHLPAMRGPGRLLAGGR